MSDLTIVVGPVKSKIVTSKPPFIIFQVVDPVTSYERTDIRPGSMIPQWQRMVHLCHKGNLTFPSGLLKRVVKALKGSGYSVKINDRRPTKDVDRKTILEKMRFLSFLVTIKLKLLLLESSTSTGCSRTPQVVEKPPCSHCYAYCMTYLRSSSLIEKR